MSVRRPKQRSSSSSTHTRKPIHTRYDQFGGHNNSIQIIETAKWKKWADRHAANYKLLFPIAAAVAKLILDPVVLCHWRKQVKIAFRKASRQKGRQHIEDIKDLPWLYVFLAHVHDRHIKFNKIITEEISSLLPDGFEILYSARLCRVYLQYVECDLENIDLFSKPSKPAAGSDEADLENKDSPKLSGRSKALIMLKQHSDWTDTRIAKEAGVNRQSMYRWPEYKLLRQLLREERSLPRGSKNKDGNIEAIDEK